MNTITNIILPLALAFIMFSLGLGLTAKDFARVIYEPKDFFLGLISQVVLLPLVGFSLATVFTLEPEIALGVMIIAASPGGVTSNILTSFGRGDVALSISLTAVTSLLSVLTIPLIVAFSYSYFFEGTVKDGMSIIRIAVSVFAIVTIPVLIGMVTRYLFEGFALSFDSIAKTISTVLFTLVLLGAIFQERTNIVEYYEDTGLVTLALNLIMLALAWGIASIFGSGTPQKIALSIECGLQNGTLAIAVATLLFGGGPTLIPAATYSLTMFFTSLIFIYFLRRKVMPK
ncbi:MAG: bile acid:sodium symporter family protein [Rhodospirillales bacterium]